MQAPGFWDSGGDAAILQKRRALERRQATLKRLRDDADELEVWKELVAEGEETGIKDLIAWAQNGPSAARVDKVDVRWRSFAGDFFDFRIVD